MRRALVRPYVGAGGTELVIPEPPSADGDLGPIDGCRIHDISGRKPR